VTTHHDSLWNRWDEVDRLFEAALDLPADERRTYLEAQCGDDDELLESVLRLLEASERSEGLFETPGAGASLAFVEELGERNESQPQRIDRYAIVRELGRGGMGTVYLAEREDGGFRQQVALKVLRRGLDTDDTLQRFVNERQILAKLSHPDIARLYDGGATPSGRPYLVMEYIEGEPITDYCDRNRLEVRQRLRLVLRVTEAVNAAHVNLIVHRDLKPSNILVTDEAHVKLLDFGIAKMLDPSEDAELTKTGSYILTPDHASPEQLRGEPITTATDVYQIGVLLFRLLTGQRPFPVERSSPLDLRQLAERSTVPKPSTTVVSADAAAEIAAARSSSPSQLRKTLRGDLDTIVTKALAAEPSRRYASAANLADDIRRYLDGRAISAQPDTFLYLTRKFLRRHPSVAPVVAAAILGVGIYIATLVRYTHQLEQERNTAQLETTRAQEVQRFMVDLFSSADPYLPADKKLGSEISVVDALAMGAERIQTSLEDRPEVRASILAAIADVYQDLNKADEALPLQEEALKLQQSLHGAASRQARDEMGMLARLQDMRGEYDVAGELHRKRLDLALAAEPQDVSEVADAHIRIGRHLLATSQYRKAEPHFQAAVDLAAANDLSWEYVDALRSLADTQRLLGKLEEAENTARLMVPQVIEVRGEGTPASAYARGTLARILGLRGKADEAEPYFAQAIEDLSNTLGPEHGDTLSTMNNLAKTRFENGDLVGAEELFVHIIETGQRALGRTHPRLGAYLQAYGTLLAQADRPDEAIEVHRRAAEIFRQTLAPDNPQRAEPLVSLSELYQEQSRLEEAERVTHELEAIRSSVPDRL